jgi:hypothetical protein
VAKTPFTVINGTPEPDKATAKRRASAKAILPPEFVRCPSCTGNAMIEIRLGMVRKYRGRPASGGQKRIVCATCLAQGRTVIVDL